MINRSDELLTRITKTKREKTHITNIRNNMRVIASNIMDFIKIIIKDY